MKRVIKIPFLIFGALFLFALSASAQSESAKNAYFRGVAAVNKGKYVEALPSLRQAALGGVSGAYGPLISLYVDGDYDKSGKGNYEEAFKWLLMAMNKCIEEGSSDQDLTVTCLMNYDPLCFLTGDYQETVDHATRGIKTGGLPKLPYLMNQIAASYLKLGHLANATEWLNDALSLSKIKDDKLSLHTANAILSKMALDKSDYDSALKLSKDAASEGKIPLAAYVYGITLIKTNNHPEIGKEWVKLAAEYNYNGLFEINCFENEIKQYWNTIRYMNF